MAFHPRNALVMSTSLISGFTCECCDVDSVMSHRHRERCGNGVRYKSLVWNSVNSVVSLYVHKRMLLTWYIFKCLYLYMAGVCILYTVELVCVFSIQ